MRMMHQVKSIKGVYLCELPAWCIEFTEQCTAVKGSERAVFTEWHGCLFKEQADNSLEHENCAERSNSERHLHHLSQAGWICSPRVCPRSCSHQLLQKLNTTPSLFQVRHFDVFCSSENSKATGLFQASRPGGQQQKCTGLALVGWKSGLHIRIFIKISLWGIISLYITIASLSDYISLLPEYYLINFLCAVNLLFLSWSFALHSN